MLEAKNLTFSYDGAHKILDSLNLSISPGEVVILGGPTGSGKSTLARCLSGFLFQDKKYSLKGSVEIDGTPVSELELAKISRQVALVQQDPESQICTLRVVDEVAFGPENFLVPITAITRTSHDSLQAVGALYLLERLSYALSGGEKQRIVIAAMLACNPKYLILDEPTSSLDPKGIAHLREILRDLRERGLGVLCIEHNISSLESVADRLLLMENGQLTQQTVPSPISKPLAVPVSGTSVSRPLLSARSVSYSYDSTPAIDSVSLDFFSSETVALMGDNGSGKSTLLALLAGLLEPSDGTIFLEDRILKNIPRTDLARRMAVVFQNPTHQIFERTVWKDQILGIELLDLPMDEYLTKATELLEQAGLLPFRDRNPFSLSHGQKRRLNISSIGYYGPMLFLFDEPFIGQDPDGKLFIQRQLAEMRSRGGISLVTTHDSSFALQSCSRIVFLEKGSVLIDGPPSSVLNWLQNNNYDEYYPEGGVE
jgi:energy-coupling factor transporter ATP-binding protein EcfA2